MLPDAVVLQPVGDSHTFYALVQDEHDKGGWEGMELTSEGTFSWRKDTPFRLVLFFLSQSAGGMTITGKQEDLSSSCETGAACSQTQI